MRKRRRGRRICRGKKNFTRLRTKRKTVQGRVDIRGEKIRGKGGETNFFKKGNCCYGKEGKKTGDGSDVITKRKKASWSQKRGPTKRLGSEKKKEEKRERARPFPICTRKKEKE